MRFSAKFVLCSRTGRGGEGRKTNSQLSRGKPWHISWEVSSENSSELDQSYQPTWGAAFGALSHLERVVQAPNLSYAFFKPSKFSSGHQVWEKSLDWDPVLQRKKRGTQWYPGDIHTTHHLPSSKWQRTGSELGFVSLPLPAGDAINTVWSSVRGKSQVLANTRT